MLRRVQVLQGVAVLPQVHVPPQKAAAAAQARLLKILLQAKTRQGEVSGQIILMCIILCTFMVLRLAGQPWRSLSNNVFDVAASCTLGILLVVTRSGMSVEVSTAASELRKH